MLFLLQLALVLAWYLWPAMADVPAWLVFLPLLAFVLVWLIGLLFVGGVAGLLALFSSASRRTR